jgi:DNA repair exonuclease SbcCD nuclease subunit
MNVHTFLFWKRLGLAALFAICLPSVTVVGQVTVAQISDTHIGDKHAPHAVANLRQAVQMINARHPDAVVLSGDIGENPQAWEEARSILADLKPPLYYAPGNHDVHSTDVERYRRVFGKDYYTFQVKDIPFVVIDSELLANIDAFDAKQPQPLPSQTEEESGDMLNWLANLRTSDESRKHDRKHGDESRARIFIGIQHIPVFRDGNFPPDTKPYWVINDPYRGQEMKILHDLGIKDMLVGHWHNGRVFDKDGITWHVAPSTSWLPWGGELGFAIHTISADGKVKTEFVDLPDGRP